MKWARQVRHILEGTALVVHLSACAAFLLFSASVAAAAPRQDTAALSPAIGARFAIADFDGDLKPDLATVHAGGSNARTTHYSIRFELSTGPAHSISLIAPTGGLQIVPQDVNGDRIPDLIVSTKWLNRLVAVLLNDGHGNFTLTDPSAFPDLMRNSQTEWSSARTRSYDQAAIPASRSSAKACGVFAAAFFVGDEENLTPLSTLDFNTAQRDFGSAGRAPPASILHV
jgi:hypothetical protein